MKQVVARRHPSLLQQRVEVHARANAEVDAVLLLDGPDVGVVHELSHAVHEHPRRPAIDFAGCREWDGRCEEEATWQAGTLLAPRGGAVVRLRRGETIEEAARHFGVTDGLFRWRANTTGIVRVLGLLRAG